MTCIMNTRIETEFRHLSTSDLMKAYANAIEATGLTTQEMVHTAQTSAFRAARLRLDVCRQTCDDLREALAARLSGSEGK
jgi:hypothetical protein